MEHFVKIGVIAAGGALGAVARYLINVSPLANLFDKFPFPTFAINVTGSFLIGFVLYFFAERADIGENLRLALMVGFIGAFTTFSTFEMEIYTLMKERFFITALLYLMLSVFVGFIGVVAGVELAKRIS